MRVFVFENVCGGGMAGEPLPAGMVAQGRAMLEAVARDFLRCGARVALSRDARVDVVVDGADIVESNGRSDEALVEAGAAGADAVLVIAPETNGVLERLTRCLARLPVRSLGSSPQAVRLCADKLHMARRLASRGIATPPTRLCPGDGRAPDGPSGVDTLVVKPRDGAGCENTFVHARGQVVAGDPRWIVQPYVPGLAASVSFVVAVDGRPRPLPAGRQHVEQEDGQLTYRGGRMPLDEPLARRATRLGFDALRCVEGLQGFVGIDLVLGDDEGADCVIEINPRLTVSYVALSALCASNLGGLLLDDTADVQWSRASASYDAQGSVRLEIFS